MEKQKGKIDYFGFLLRKWSFDFDNIRISILENYDEIKAYIEKHKNRDEFIYPPMSRRRLFDPFKNEWGEVIPNTERTALLFHINASHSIFIDSSTSIEEDRKGQVAFLVHLLGYLCGTRLQFHNWWIDMRIKIREKSGIWIINEKTAQHFF